LSLSWLIVVFTRAINTAHPIKTLVCCVVNLIHTGCLNFK
jgi:hypothetical protein